MTSANVSLHLDRLALARLVALGYLRPTDRDPGAVREAVWSILADRLASNPVAHAHALGV
ncbi:hypothetical protein ACFQX4_26725 [Roseomonas sp. GCM10028921]